MVVDSVDIWEIAYLVILLSRLNVSPLGLDEEGTCLKFRICLLVPNNRLAVLRLLRSCWYYWSRDERISGVPIVGWTISFADRTQSLQQMRALCRPQWLPNRIRFPPLRLQQKLLVCCLMSLERIILRWHLPKMQNLNLAPTSTLIFCCLECKNHRILTTRWRGDMCSEPDLPTTDLSTIWFGVTGVCVCVCVCMCQERKSRWNHTSVAHHDRNAIEENTKNSLVIFAIAGRPLTGSVDLKKISDFVQLHTVRGFSCVYVCVCVCVCDKFVAEEMTLLICCVCEAFYETM